MPPLVEHVIHPVFASEPHTMAPDGAMLGWLIEPPGALVQVVKPVNCTSELANWLVGPAFDVLAARFPARNDLTLILDLKHMAGRSAAARSILLHSAKVLAPRFSRMFVVPPVDYPRMYQRAFHASIAFVRLLGTDVVVTGSSRAVVDRYAIVALR